MQEAVLVVPAGMDQALQSTALEACRQAQVRSFVLGEDGAASSSPALLLAGLPRGERRIPAEVTTLMAHSYRGVPLLLLCDEPLVRPSITLQNGRVSLLGDPLSCDRISNRIRTALVAREPSSRSGSGDSSEPSPLRVREYRGREWWAGAVGRKSSDDDADSFPGILRVGRHGIVGLVALAAGGVLTPAESSQLAELVSAQAPDAALASLDARLGQSAAAAWYVPSSHSWCIYLPGDARCWLFSASRLPNQWRVAPGPRGWRKLAAGAGDCLLLSYRTGGPDLLEVDLADGTLFRVAAGGGPSLLDHFETRFSQAMSGAAFVVEVR